jgi:hypothetical protein
MSYALTNLIQNSFTRLGNGYYFRGTVVSGTNATIIDDSAGSPLTDKSEDELLKATLILVRDAAGGDLAPQGEFSVITAFDTTTKQMTFSPVLSGAVGVGDEYMVVFPQYPLVELRRLANISLASVGKIALWDNSLDVVDGQTEYDLPVSIKSAEPLSVWMDFGNGYTQVSDYYIRPSAAGTVGTLVFSDSYSSDKCLGIMYADVHPEVYDFDDAIHETVDKNLVEIYLAVQVITWSGLGDDNTDLFNNLNSQLGQLQKTSRIWKPTRSNLLIF